MNRSDFYYRQIVTEAELDQVFDDVETVIDGQITDQNYGDHNVWGVFNGFVVSEQAVPDLTVKVTDGIAFDENGKRIVLTGGPTTVDLTSQVPTTVGYMRAVRIYAEHLAVESDPRIDGHAASLNYRTVDSCTLSIDPGAQGVSPVRPALASGKVAIATVILNYGDTFIDNSWIFQGLGMANILGQPEDEIDRQEGGYLAAGIRNVRQLAFSGSAPNAPYDMISMGSNHINTEGGDFKTADISDPHSGGNLFLCDGNIYRGEMVQAGGPPNVGSNRGFVYIDNTGSGTYGDKIGVTKWHQYHANAFSPGDNNGTDPYDFVGTIPLNVWWKDSFTDNMSPAPAPPAPGLPVWRVKASAPVGPYPRYTWPLFLPLTGLPYGCRLEKVEVFIRCPTTQHGATESMYTEIWRTAHDNGAVLATDDFQVSTSGYHREGPVISGGEIMDNEAYQYCLVVYIKHTANVGDRDIQFIFGARAQYTIREASGQY